jgi:hypothetical protein
MLLTITSLLCFAFFPVFAYIGLTKWKQMESIQKTIVVAWPILFAMFALWDMANAGLATDLKSFSVYGIRIYVH